MENRTKAEEFGKKNPAVSISTAQSHFLPGMQTRIGM